MKRLNVGILPLILAVSFFSVTLAQKNLGDADNGYSLRVPQDWFGKGIADYYAEWEETTAQSWSFAHFQHNVGKEVDLSSLNLSYLGFFKTF